MNVIWKKGIHGISFFQNSLMLGMDSLKENLGKEIAKGLIDDIKNKL